jgi:RNA polymerase sigma factor (sigma-70 family)
MDAASDADDTSLLLAIAGGDEDALHVLVLRHSAWLKIRLARRCADPDAVADVLQDTFVAAWKGARQWRGDGEVAAWLWGIAVRRLVSRVQRQKVPSMLPLETESFDSGRFRVEEQLLLGVEHGDVGSALRKLSPELRAVVQATILDGLSTRETAQLLGLPQGTVKGRIRKAKSQLRTELIAES